MMLYPKSATVIANIVVSLIGTIEMIPAEAPMTLFVWGPQRVLPVRVTSLSITEEAHDPLLNPIRAKVDLSLAVLSYRPAADRQDVLPGASHCERNHGHDQYVQ